jgi:hypothetical protein
MSVLTLVVAGILAVAVWLSFRRRALKRDERLTSAVVLDSERSMLMGLIFTVSAFFVSPDIGWRYALAAVLGGSVLGLALAHRYALRGERQLARRDRLREPYNLKPAKWSPAWWLLLLACVGLLFISSLRNPLLPYRDALLAWPALGGVMLAEGLYLRLWARGKGAMPAPN